MGSRPGSGHMQLKHTPGGGEENTTHREGHRERKPLRESVRRAPHVRACAVGSFKCRDTAQSSENRQRQNAAGPTDMYVRGGQTSQEGSFPAPKSLLEDTVRQMEGIPSRQGTGVL